MPITVIERSDHRHVLGTGVVSAADAEGYADYLRAHGLRPALIDLEAVVTMATDFARMMHYVRRMEQLPGPPARTAILATRALTHGFARMYRSLCDDGTRIHIGDDRERAMAWIRGHHDAKYPDS
jgi:hypothetical protein